MILQLAGAIEYSCGPNARRSFTFASARPIVERYLRLVSFPGANPGIYTFQLGFEGGYWTVSVTIGESGKIIEAGIPRGEHPHYYSPGLLQITDYMRLYSLGKLGPFSATEEMFKIPETNCDGVGSYCCRCSEWNEVIDQFEGLKYTLPNPLVPIYFNVTGGATVFRTPGTISIQGVLVEPGRFGCPGGKFTKDRSEVGPSYADLTISWYAPGAPIPPEDIPKVTFEFFNPGGPGGQGVTVIIPEVGSIYIPSGESESVDVPVTVPGTEIQPEIIFDDGTTYTTTPFTWDPDDPNDPTNDGEPVVIYIPPPKPNPDPEPGPEPEPDGDTPVYGNFQGCIRRDCTIPYLYTYKSKP